MNRKWYFIFKPKLMRNYKDINYNDILTVIDVFSKYASAIAIRNKSGYEVSSVFQQGYPKNFILIKVQNS